MRGVGLACLEVLRSNGRHVGDSENKANGIENVGFPTAVKASDRVEALIPRSVSYDHRVVLVALFTILR